MSDTPFPHFIERPDTRPDDPCGFVHTVGFWRLRVKIECRRLGVWHVVWDMDGNHAFVCGRHMHMTRRRFMFLTKHPRTNACRDSATLLLDPDEDFSYCEVET